MRVAIKTWAKLSMYIYNGYAIMRRERILFIYKTYMLHTISILILRKAHYKIWLRKLFLAPNMSASLQAT